MVRIGDSIKRNEDPILLRGMGNFVADINHFGQIYMKVVRSNIAFGKIRNINPKSEERKDILKSDYESEDLILKLKELKKMYNEGAINENEFKLAKEIILNKK